MDKYKKQFKSLRDDLIKKNTDNSTELRQAIIYCNESIKELSAYEKKEKAKASKEAPTE